MESKYSMYQPINESSCSHANNSTNHYFKQNKTIPRDSTTYLHSTINRLHHIHRVCNNLQIEEVMSNICHYCGKDMTIYIQKEKEFYKYEHDLLLKSLQIQMNINSSDEMNKSEDNNSSSINDSLSMIEQVEQDIIRMKEIIKVSSIEYSQLIEKIHSIQVKLNLAQKDEEDIEEKMDRLLILSQQAFSEISFLTNNKKKYQMSPLFHISSTYEDHDIRFQYQINGLSLRLSGTDEDIHEIDAAWSCFANMINCLRNRYNMDDAVVISSSKSLEHPHEASFYVEKIKLIPLRGYLIFNLYMVSTDLSCSNQNKTISFNYSKAPQLHFQLFLLLCIFVIKTFQELEGDKFILDEYLSIVYGYFSNHKYFLKMIHNKIKIIIPNELYQYDRNKCVSFNTRNNILQSLLTMVTNLIS